MKLTPSRSSAQLRPSLLMALRALDSSLGCDHLSSSDGLSFDNTAPGTLTSAISSTLSVNLSGLAGTAAETAAGDGLMVDELQTESDVLEPSAAQR